jgi:glycosyltransferase involved in cell wall biosynthesis
MKILQVINAFPPAWGTGGPVRATYEISKELVKRGHEVTVYTTDVYNPNSRLKYEKNPMDMDGIVVYHFKNLSDGLAWKNIPIALGMASALNGNIKNFDIVHAHLYRCFQSMIVHHYAKTYGIPYILQPRGSVPTISKSKQKKLFDTLFGRSIFKDASKIIASSKIESDQYRDVFPDLKNEKIVHIPNGIDLETYQNLPQKGKFKKKYSINGNEKIILFLSRIHKRKGADILVEAFSKLKNEIENVKLVIAGPDEGYCDKLKLIVSKLDIESDVIFPGPLYEKDKLEAYIDADVFILPSKDRYESFGNVVLEACACGTPVILTNNCGVSEWFGDDVGYVVGYDKEELQNALFKILSDEGLRRRFGEEGKKLVREKFGWDRIILDVENVYNEVVL